LREGDKEKAAESWRKAGQYAGDDIELRSALAASLLDNRFYDAALEEAEKILRLDSLHIDSYYRKWSAKMNITYGAEETRAEVLRDIRKLESEHHRDVRALAIALSGYEMLDDRKAAARTRKSILSLDPGYFDRQPFDFSFRTPSGRLVHIGGAPARKFNETFTTEDPRARLEIFAQLDKEIEDQNVRLYLLYPQMLSAYVSVADVANARRLLQALIDAGVEGSEIASNQLQVARLCFDTKIDLDLALDYARQSVERLRKPSPAPDLKSPDSADLLALAEEYRLFQLAEALSLQGSILLARGLADQAVSPLEESFRVSEREETALDLGLACAKAGQNQKAIEFLTRAYVYDGKLKGEALKALRSVYGEREKTLKLMLDGAVARHRESMREAAIAQAIREMGRTERKTAPAFELSTLEGRKVALSELAGKIVLMNFWATW
jgi:tetratricopeptide (TPR) repeat protein